MAHPSFLNRELSVQIEPALMLLKNLTEMEKLASHATLIVTQDKKIQILIRSSNFCAVLDMVPKSIFAPSNSDGFCVLFRISAWLQALTNPANEEPEALLSIRKNPGSMNLYCKFGMGQRYISLGIAEFTKQSAMTTHIPCSVRVSMTTTQFIDFIYAFARVHNEQVSAVQMEITTSVIRWVSETRPYSQPAQGFFIEGHTPFQFRLRWNMSLFRMFCSLSVAYIRVELSVLINLEGVKYYRFLFLPCTPNTCVFYYLEREYLPPLQVFAT